MLSAMTGHFTWCLSLWRLWNALDGFGMFWQSFSCADESCRVSRPKSRKHVDGFDGLSGCLKFSRL